MSPPLVLCIDDRLQQLEIRKAALESRGFRVEAATNGCSAIKILQDTLVDAVLLEYKEEGMDAEALAYQINQRFPDVPIILLSAYFDMPERILWLVDEYVMKSELPGGLVRVLERVTRPVKTDEALTLALSTAEPCPHKTMPSQIAVCSVCDKRVTLREDTFIDGNGTVIHTHCQVKQLLAS
ncbi:MAG TPA: response regulator [Candidatus Eremiobacteraceae bacterium]|nr:response regulator [Candidatus Eremiobacteraceae bacterium]